MASIKRFVIVDDEEANSLFFQVALKEMGFEDVVTASSGQDGLAALEKHKPQFVIVAWEMESMSGTIFIQKVRQKRSRKYLPCLIYSKRMGDDDVALTKELGYENILSMPFDKKICQDKIREIIEAEENLDPVESTLRKIEGYLADTKPMEAMKLIAPKLTRKNSPYLTRSLAAIGDMWVQLQKYDKAEKAIKDCLEVDPDYLPGLRVQARLFSRTDRHAESIATLEKITQKSPLNMTSKVSLGEAYVEADKHDEAKQLFEDISDLDPDNQQAKDAHAKMAIKEGDMSLAAQLLAETEYGEEMVRVFNNSAVSLVNENQLPKAIETYNSALRILSDKANLHRIQYNLGLALRKNKQLKEAFATLCESYASDPSFEKAYVALARVAKELKAAKQPLDAALVAKVKEIRAANPGPESAKKSA